MSLVGRSVRRLEDRPLLTGAGRFVADLSLPGQLHMRVVRSPVAFGRLEDVQVDEALALSGVVAAWTGAELADLPPIAFRQIGLPELEPYRQPVLAREMLRYVGEPVAVIFAEDAYLAEDVAERVVVEVEELPPVLDPQAEPVLFDAQHTTEAAVLEAHYGDPEGAFEEAEVVVELELAVGRHTGVPLETRGALARYDSVRGVLEVLGAAKVPHYNRDALAAMLDLPPTRVVLREGHVGGGFGVRGELYPEDVLVCLGALRLGRPVKWIEDRREHLVATNHSRDQVHRIRAAVRPDGEVLAVEDEFWLDQGAYVRTHAATVPNLSATMLPGPYRFPSYRVVGHIRLTNKTPAGTYRAPGRYETTFVRERLMDAVAARLGLDPAEVRRRNLIGAEEMPFARPLETLGTDLEYDSGDYPVLLERVLDHLDYPTLREGLAERRAAGEMVGMGLGFFVEKSGLGPAEGARVTVDEEGVVTVVTGAASLGQGMETVLAQITAEAMGAELGRVRVIHGQTDAISQGWGAFASRVTVMSGSAAHLAAREVRKKAERVAAGLLEAAEADLEIVEGRIWVRGSPEEPHLTLGEVARELGPASAHRYGEEPGLTAECWFRAGHMTYPYGLHVAVVRVDPELGGVKVLRYLVAYDVGRAVNPMLVKGQIVGAAAQGLGGALLEEFRYSEEGQPLCTSFMDYLLPTAAETPPIEVLLSEDAPSPLNPLGVKGAGEGGITGCGAAVAGAVEEALQLPGGVVRIPLTPERVRELCRRALAAH